MSRRVQKVVRPGKVHQAGTLPAAVGTRCVLRSGRRLGPFLSSEPSSRWQKVRVGQRSWSGAPPTCRAWHTGSVLLEDGVGGGRQAGGPGAGLWRGDGNPGHGAVRERQGRGNHHGNQGKPAHHSQKVSAGREERKRRRSRVSSRPEGGGRFTGSRSFTTSSFTVWQKLWKKRRRRLIGPTGLGPPRVPAAARRAGPLGFTS